MLFNWVLLLHVILNVVAEHRLMERLPRTPQMQKQNTAKEPFVSNISDDDGSPLPNGSKPASSTDQRKTTLITLLNEDDPLSDFEVSQMRKHCKPPSVCVPNASVNAENFPYVVNDLVLTENPLEDTMTFKNSVTRPSTHAGKVPVNVSQKSSENKQRPKATTSRVKKIQKVFYTTSILYQTTDSSETFKTENLFEDAEETTIASTPSSLATKRKSKTTVPTTSTTKSKGNSLIPLASRSGITQRPFAVHGPPKFNTFKSVLTQSHVVKHGQGTEPEINKSTEFKNELPQRNLISSSREPGQNQAPWQFIPKDPREFQRIPSNTGFVDTFSANQFHTLANKGNGFSEIAFTSHNGNIGSVVQTKYYVPSTYFPNEGFPREMQKDYQFKETKFSSSSSRKYTSVNVNPPHNIPGTSRLSNPYGDLQYYQTGPFF